MIQDHIHLDTVLGTDNAPTRTWTVISSNPIPNIIDALERDLSGRLVKHQLGDTSGRILFWDYQVIIKIVTYDAQLTIEKIEELAALSGQQVYFVDNVHPNSGTDHASYVKTMYMKLGQVRPMSGDTNWQAALVEIELVDDHL